MPIPAGSAVATGTVNQGNGQYYQAALLDKVFMGGTLIAGVALPVMAATLATKFTLWNPPASGIVVEPIELGLGITSATTVVNGFGFACMYGVSTQASGAPTSPTIAAGATGTTTGGISTDGKQTSKAQLYSALTLTNTAVFGPVVQIIPGFGAVTDGSLAPPPYQFNGKVVLPPDSLITFVTNVIAETAMTCSLIWAEW